MARSLKFKISGKEYEAVPEKLDRSKLYGTHEILALDDNGRECKLAAMDESGTVIITTGATALASVSDTGNWVDKSELMAVNPDGTAAALIPSSYSHTVELAETVTDDEYLSYNIYTLYTLFDAEGDLAERIGGDIYSFDYSYSDSYEASKAFILANGEDIFMAVGSLAKFELVGLAEAVVIDAQEDEEAGEDDGIDFGMF
jgi:hypothetical protein